MTQRSQQNSIDGFITNNPTRHIGFNNTARSQQPVTSHRVRMRRPGLHGVPISDRQPVSSRPSLSTKRPQARRDLPEFTSYTASQQSKSQLPSANGHQSGRSPSRSGRFGAGKPLKSKATKPGNFFTRTNWKRIFKRTAMITGIFVLLASGWLGWKFFNNSSRVFGGDSSVLGFLNATKLKGEDKGQVNMVLAGVSTDDPGHSGAELTDSIMLISYDTVNKKATIVSIPRDLWTNIPGYGYAKINAANAYGEGDNFAQSGYPDGGMGLLEQVISENLDMPIHYYAKLNYSALRDAVNAVGGIEVNIKSTDPRGLYDPNISAADKGPLKLPNGVQRLDGQTALNLARARGNPPGDGRYPYGFERSDFTRGEHQRLMLLALKQRVTSGSVITNPLKIGQLFDVVGKNMKTDLQPSEIRRLYDLSKQTKDSNIQSLSLNDADGVNLLASYRSSDGASSLIPAAGIDDFSAIKLYLKKALTNDPVVRESSKIVILNGGDRTGLASKISNGLTSKGLNVVAVGDAPRQEGGNIIIDQTNGAKPATKARLQQIFGGSADGQNSGNYPTADFIVILGTNQQPPASTTSDD